MNKIAVALVGVAIMAGAFYCYLPGHRSNLTENQHQNSTLLVNKQMPQTEEVQQSSSNGQFTLSTSPAPKSVIEEGLSSEEQLHNLKNMMEQKYSILFSMLSMSEQTQHTIRTHLLQREKILSSPFYDASSNEAEVAANLRKREADVAEIDQKIESLLSEDDVKKYRVLKDSSYEQALMNNFYELANAESSLSAEHKNKILLAKLEQKQSATNLLQTESDAIKNASPDTRAYLIEKMHQAMVSDKEAYLRNAKSLLNDEQFDVLKDYEQQLFDERWQDIRSGLTAE